MSRANMISWMEWYHVVVGGPLTLTLYEQNNDYHYSTPYILSSRYTNVILASNSLVLHSWGIPTYYDGFADYCRSWAWV